METVVLQENHENGRIICEKQFISSQSRVPDQCSVGYVHSQKLIQYCDQVPNLKGRVGIYLHDFQQINMIKYSHSIRHL